MAAISRSAYLLLLFSVFFSTTVYAGPYIGLAPAVIQIKTDAGKTRPVMADMRLGYALDAHRFELAVMTPVSDDNLNGLVTEVASSTSVFYRYTANLKSTLNIDFILGYSQTEIDAAYLQPPDFNETFTGLSFGIGFEEALKSIPQLKVKFDYIKLYRGDQLDIDAFSLGVRYEF